MKLLKISMTLALIFVFLLQFGCFSFPSSQPSGDKNAKYLVEVGNGWLKAKYYCDRYEKIDNIYRLYSKENELIFEIDVPASYYFTVELNKERK